MRRLLPLRAWTLLLLAVALCGCPPPLYSVLYREPPPPEGLFYRATSCPPADTAEAGGVGGTVACQPGAFNRLVSERGVGRVEVQTFGGRRVRGESIVIRRDTAYVGSEAVPMLSVDRVHLIDRRGAREGVGAVALTTALAAATGALVGLTHDADRVDGARRGAAGGATLGLALGLLLPPASPSRSFDVFGWADRPQVANVLAASDTLLLPRPSSPYGPGCRGRLPAAVPFERSFVRCVTAEELTARAGAAWVQEVELRLRSGASVRGDGLLVSDSEAVVDGRALPLASVERVVLRHPHGPLRPVRRTLKATALGAAWGALVGSGVALVDNDPDAIWRSAAAVGSTVGLGVLLVNGLVPNEAARDVTYFPDPEP